MCMMSVVEEKSCVSRVQKSSGTYRFRIEGFSGLSTRVGDSVESPEFSLCGFVWQLRIFPGGSLEAHKGFISYYLASKSNRMARASYKLSILNQVIGGQDEVFASSGIRVFEAKGVQVDGWGRDKFMQASMLKDPDFGFWVDDAVIFKVEITAFGDLEEAKIGGSLDGAVPEGKGCTLTAALRNLFNNSLGSDLDLWLGPQREKFHAHKCILAARSEVFAAMFSCDMREARSGELWIAEFDPFVVKEMLLFLYTDTLPDKPFLDEHAPALLALAIKYQVIGVIVHCEEHFCSATSCENAIAILKLADAVGAHTLKQKVLHFVAQNANQITMSKDFSELEEELRQETETMIEMVNKRRGCRGVVEKERRMQMNCAIM